MAERQSVDNIKTWKLMVRVIAFFIVGIMLFTWVSYLFRPVSPSRKNIVGYYALEENSIDTVFVGGSSIYVFWAPLMGWNEFGFASYNFAIDSMRSFLMLYLFDELLKTQTPELIVCDVRSFVKVLDEDDYEAPLRNGVDSFSYSLNRFRAIKNILPNNYSPIEYYLDIAKYHTNTSALTDETQWLYSSNRVESYNKGFSLMQKHEALENINYSDINEIGEIPASTKDNLEALLDYCDGKKLNVLFVSTPYQMPSAETKKEMNAIKQKVESRGYLFVDGIDSFDEIGLDFKTDFYDTYHINIYGAEKFTRFLGKYIAEHFSLPDRRADDAYQQWYLDYARWMINVEKTKIIIDQLIQQSIV